MAGKSIGELNVKILADSKQFFNEIGRAEKSLTQFAAKVASPFSFGAGAIGGLAGLVSAPIGMLTGSIGKFIEQIPGMDEFEMFFNPAKYAAAMKEVKEGTYELARAASLLNIDPQFLKALRMTAGPLQDDLMPAMQRLLAFQGEIRKGGEDALSAGGRGAKGIAEKWGFDPQELANLTSEQLLLKFADQLKEVGSQSERVRMAMDVLGKSGAKLTNVFAQGSESIQKWLDLVKEAGVGSPELVAVTKAVKMLEKLHALEVEGMKAQEYMRTGVISDFYAAKLEMAPTLSDDWFKYMSLYLSSRMPTLGVPMKMPEELRKRIEAIKEIAEPPEVDLAEETAADKANAAIQKMNEDLDEQRQLLRYTNEGWAGFEKQIMAVQKAFDAGADPAQAQLLLDRLAGLRDRARAGEREKSVADFEKRIMAEMRAGGGGPRFAPVDLAGSAAAAADFNRQWAGGGETPLDAAIKRVTDKMDENKFDEQTRTNIRNAAMELEKLNRKLNPIGAVNEG